MTELERLARETGLPFTQIARRCEIGRVHLYAVLRGQTVPDTLRAASLAEVLGITQARLNALIVAAREEYRQAREAVKDAAS